MGLSQHEQKKLDDAIVDFARQNGAVSLTEVAEKFGLHVKAAKKVLHDLKQCCRMDRDAKDGDDAWKACVVKDYKPKPFNNVGLPT